jgi:hypothetical protein
MTEKQALETFEKNNPAQAVTRCPYGRAPLRELLDTYAKAAVNLYGVIPVTEFVLIFNNLSGERTTSDEVFTLLLPLVRKQLWYCFFEGYIIHYWLVDEFDEVGHWLRWQSDKPRFIPKRDEFLRYADQNYEDETQRSHWWELCAFVFEGEFAGHDTYLFYEDLKSIPEGSTLVQDVNALFEEYGIVFDSDDQVQTLLSLLIDARNNTRMWINKGHTPYELDKIIVRQHSESAEPGYTLQQRRKVSPNEPCPCGSGKKYKKCCRLIDEAMTAQLTESECVLFYETWYGLLGFVNEMERVIGIEIEPIYPNPVGDELFHAVRNVLWENPGYIDDYAVTANLPEEKTTLLRSWSGNHKKGMFFIVDYKPEYAVLLGGEDGVDILYGVKGISRSLADAMQRELPTSIETVLLPFKDRIIYDGFVSAMPIHYADGAKQMFGEMYDRALERGIVTNLC